MSDMMPQRPPQGPPQGGMQGKMSMFNPTDVAAKAAMGDVRPDMTVGEFLQRNFGVSPDDPVQKLVEATKQQMQNRTMAGKLSLRKSGALGSLGIGSSPLSPSSGFTPKAHRDCGARCA